jgi:hypothetical protein
MSMQVADCVLARLREWGVEQVFVYPDDGVNSLVAAFERAENSPRFVKSRHEEMSAFQATGYAKFRGTVGVCTATSGPGAIHLLNGLYSAELDHAPVVALVSQTARTAMTRRAPTTVIIPADLQGPHEKKVRPYPKMRTTTSHPPRPRRRLSPQCPNASESGRLMAEVAARTCGAAGSDRTPGRYRSLAAHATTSLSIPVAGDFEAGTGQSKVGRSPLVTR